MRVLIHVKKTVPILIFYIVKEETIGSGIPESRQWSCSDSLFILRGNMFLILYQVFCFAALNSTPYHFPCFWYLDSINNQSWSKLQAKVNLVRSLGLTLRQKFKCAGENDPISLQEVMWQLSVCKEFGQ